MSNTIRSVTKPIPHGLTIAVVLAVIMFGAVWLAINRVSKDADAWAYKASQHQVQISGDIAS